MVEPTSGRRRKAVWTTERKKEAAYHAVVILACIIAIAYIWAGSQITF